MQPCGIMILKVMYHCYQFTTVRDYSITILLGLS